MSSNVATREYVSDDNAVACRARPGLFVMVVRGKALAEHLAGVTRVWRDDVLGPQMIYLLHVEPRSVRDVPDEGFRTGASALLKAPGREVVKSAVVVPVEGFVGATTRGVLTGMSWLSGGDWQIHSALDEAAKAVVSSSSSSLVSIDAATIVGAVEALRARLDNR